MLDVGPNAKEALIKKLESNRKYQEDALKHTEALLALVHTGEDDRKVLENILEDNARGWLLIAHNWPGVFTGGVGHTLLPVVDAWLTHRFELPTKNERLPRSFVITTRFEEGCAHIAVQRCVTNEKNEVIDHSEELRHSFLRTFRSGIELEVDTHRMVLDFHPSRELLIQRSGVTREWGGDGEPISRYSYYDVRRVCLPSEDHEKAPRSL